MKTYRDWSAYKEAGVGDAYADIPSHGGDFAKAVAVCIRRGQCESHGKSLMCPSYRVSGNAYFYCDPEIAESAIAVLSAGGYRVWIAAPQREDAPAERPPCCDRTSLPGGPSSG